MDSDDERSQINELSPVQVKMQGGRIISLEIDLGKTVQELKQAVAARTGIHPDNQWLYHAGRILSNPDTLRSYEMDLGYSIRLVHIGPAAPSTSTGSMPRESTPTPPTGSNELGPYKIHPRFINQIAMAKLMKNMPRLSNLEVFPTCWPRSLENANVLHTFLLYQLYKSVLKEGIHIDANDPDNSESGYKAPKVACMYYAQSGIPHGTEGQLQLGLMGFSFVDTTVEGSESSNANRSESAPNTEPLPNPWAASSYIGGSWSQMEQVPDSILPDRGGSSSQTKQVPDSDDELMDLSDWEEVHKRSVNILVPIILSDATLLRHCKERGRSVAHAYLDVVNAHDKCLTLNHEVNMIPNSVCDCRDQFDAVLNELDMELGEYIHPMLEKLYPIPHIVYYVWVASNDGGTGVTRNVAEPEVLFALKLAEMEQMGFIDRRENIIALLSSWGDAKKAVERLNVRKTKSEVARK